MVNGSTIIVYTLKIKYKGIYDRAYISIETRRPAKRTIFTILDSPYWCKSSIPIINIPTSMPRRALMRTNEKLILAAANNMLTNTTYLPNVNGGIKKSITSQNNHNKMRSIKVNA